MGSPFKMKPKSPMMKALVGGQGNLPQHLQEKILAAPETAKKGSPAKSYGSKTKSPVMQKETKGKKKFGEADAETREKQSVGTAGTGMQRSAGQRKGKIGGVTVKANVGKQRGATDLLEVAKDSYSKAKKYVKGKLGISKMEDNSPVKKRKISEKAAKRKVSKGKGFISSSFGKNPKKSYTKFTKEGRKQLKTTGKVSGTEFKKSTPIKKSGVKALEAQRGTKNPSPLKKEHLKKKDTKGKTKLPDIAGRDKEGNLKAKRGPRSGSIGGVRVSIQTKGRSTKNTDLLPYIKKGMKALKGKGGVGSGARARKRSRS